MASGRFVKNDKSAEKRARDVKKRTQKLIKEKGYIYIKPEPKSVKKGGDVDKLKELNNRSWMILVLCALFISIALFG